mmetsp:Transcript_144143/g.268542  ORF Transcript_144143/g.268542 Transcript_144143/m.268542 type:complete len:723 (+) Transcript_144143:49-2217(+)
MGVEITPWLVVIDRTLQVVSSWVSGQSPEVLAARAEKYRAWHRCDIVVETSEGLAVDWLREDYEVGRVECYSREKRDLRTTALSYSCKPANFGGLLEGVVTFQLLRVQAKVSEPARCPTGPSEASCQSLAVAGLQAMDVGESAAEDLTIADAASSELAAGDVVPNSAVPCLTAVQELTAGLLSPGEANCTREASAGGARDQLATGADALHEQIAGEAASCAAELLAEQVPLGQASSSGKDPDVSDAGGAPSSTAASFPSASGQVATDTSGSRQASNTQCTGEVAALDVTSSSNVGEQNADEVVLHVEDASISTLGPAASDASTQAPPQALDTATTAAHATSRPLPKELPVVGNAPRRGAPVSATAPGPRVMQRRVSGKKRRFSHGQKGGVRPSPSRKCQAQGTELPVRPVRTRCPPEAASSASVAGVESIWDWAIASWSRWCPFRKQRELQAPNKPEVVDAGVPVAEASRAPPKAPPSPEIGPDTASLEASTSAGTAEPPPCERPPHAVSSDAALPSATPCCTLGVSSDTSMMLDTQVSGAADKTSDEPISHPTGKLPKAQSAVAMGLCCIYFLVDPAGGSRFGACCSEEEACVGTKPSPQSKAPRPEAQVANTKAVVSLPDAQDDPWWDVCTRRWGRGRQPEPRPSHPTQVRFWHAAARLVFNANERMPPREELAGVTIQAEMTTSLDAKLQVRLSCSDCTTDVQQATPNLATLIPIAPIK